MLLRVIEQKSFMRIGSNIVRNVDVKIISATNADLKTMIEKRTFRSDLYFRLCTLNLRLPPLRERGQDIILLAESFIENISTRLGLSARKHLAEDTKELMLRLPWTGNVRELQNVMERVVQLVPTQIVTPNDLSLCLDFSLSDLPTIHAPTLPSDPPPSAIPVSGSMQTGLTRESIQKALEYNHYNRTMTAAYLGISRKTLYRKLDEFNIQL